DPWWAALLVPAVWVTYEYLVGVTSAHGTFGNLVYTQMNFLPVLQLASVFGVWGVTFCVLFFAAAVAALLSGAGTAGQRQMFAAAAGLLMLVMLTFGWWRVHFYARTGTLGDGRSAGLGSAAKCGGGGSG